MVAAKIAPIFILVAIAAVFFGIHYEPRTTMFVNVLHVFQKVIGIFATPMHLIKENDSAAIERYRWLYRQTSQFAPREQVASKELLQLPSSTGSHTIPVTLYKPQIAVENAKEQLPVVMYFHGGGYTLGGVEMYEHITTAITKRAMVAVVFVDYRLAPEHKFPAAHEDCIDATRWFLDATNTAALGLDSTRVGVAGDSAGGNIAAVVGAELPTSLKVLVSIYPGGLMPGIITPSMLENAHAPMLSIHTANWFHTMYFGKDVRNLTFHPMHSPINRELPHQQHSLNIEDTVAESVTVAEPSSAAEAVAVSADGELAPEDSAATDNNCTQQQQEKQEKQCAKKLIYPITHVITAELDILRDDGEIYVDFLREAGVNVSHVRYNNTPHGFFGLNMFPHGQEALYSVCSLIKENL